jgi:hypothetical protein
LFCLWKSYSAIFLSFCSPFFFLHLGKFLIWWISWRFLIFNIFLNIVKALNSL